MTGATWLRVCRPDELVPGRPISRQVGSPDQDGHRVCVIADDGLVVALLDRCPHRDIALSGGIVRDGELVCPGHFWRFDLVTGRRPDDPGSSLTRYETRVEGGWIEALIPDAAPRRSMRAWLLAEAAARGRGTDPA